MGRINPWLQELIVLSEQRGLEAEGFHVVIELEPWARAEDVKPELERIEGVSIYGQTRGFIFADVKDPATLESVARVRGVRLVSYEKRLYPMAVGIDELFKRVAVMEDPLLSRLGRAELDRLGIRMKPMVELPKPFQALLENLSELRGLVMDPFSLLLRLLESAPLSFPFPPVVTRAGWRLVTETRALMDAPDDYRVSDETKVGVIDSGLNPHPAMREVYEYVTLAFDPLPGDCMGHGMHVTTTAFGTYAPCRYGFFTPVASASSMLHVKVFSAVGPATSYHVMKAMELCAERGCRVVNMSLGGPLQGTVEEDPECVLLDRLAKEYGTAFICAAGNDGPDRWSIASPACALKALAVGAIDWETLDASSYSSRGPQGAWYRDHKELFERDHSRYGEGFIKPDCTGIGGDRNSQVVAGCTGWYDLLGVYDFLPDGFEMMTGTSQASPHCAGIASLLLDRGMVACVEDVKERLKERYEEKSVDRGYGLLSYRLFGR